MTLKLDVCAKLRITYNADVDNFIGDRKWELPASLTAPSLLDAVLDQACEATFLCQPLGDNNPSKGGTRAT
jgi:hypothetical protein